MKSKTCPFCKNKAELKPLIDPYKGVEGPDRLVLYDITCGTPGCYLEDGASHYVSKGEISSLFDMWAHIPDWAEPDRTPAKKALQHKGKPLKKTIHYSPDNKKESVVCSARSMAQAWTDDKSVVSPVNCSRCVKSKAFKS